MITLIELYVKKLEQQLNNIDETKQTKLWNKIKLNEKILSYSICVNNNKFNSKSICIKILKDSSLFNTPIYKELSNKILNNNILARTLINNINETFLLLLLNNNNLKLNRSQKIFLINEANDLPYTKKYYSDNINNVNFIHGNGIIDLRYEIICNKSFTLQEKKNLINFFYPDNGLKINILEELEWELLNTLKIDNNSDKDIDKIYNITNMELKELFNDEKKELEIINKINLCKYIKKLIPNEYIIKYKNND